MNLRGGGRAVGACMASGGRPDEGSCGGSVLSTPPRAECAQRLAQAAAEHGGGFARSVWIYIYIYIYVFHLR